MKSIKYSFWLLIFLFTQIISVTACGKKADLRLEPEILPVGVKKIKVKQIGNNIRIKWNYPEFLSDDSTTLNPENIGKVYIYFLNTDYPYKKFRKKSKIIYKTEQNKIEKVNDLYTIDIPFKVAKLDGKTYYFSIRYKYGKKKSPMGKTVNIVTKIPIFPIEDLKVSLESKTILLKWSKPSKDIIGNNVTEITGYKIFRKVIATEPSEETPDFIRINKDKIVENSFEDSDSGVNGTYFYYVTVIISDNVYSEKSNIVKIDIQDKFPPEIPGNVTAFKAEKFIFISWSPVSDNDLAYYRVYRKSGKNGNFVLIADKITEHKFKDNKVKKGIRYFYSVTSVDNNGNESDDSNYSSETF